MGRTTVDDEKDAEFLAARFNPIFAFADEYNLSKLIRQDIDWVWDKRRPSIPKYKNRPVSAWWSPEALAVGPGNFATVGDHLIPAKVFVLRLAEIRKRRPLTGDDLLPYVRIPLAIITTAEDATLNANQLRDAMPAGWSWSDFERAPATAIWARHQAVGFDVTTYRQWPGPGVVGGSDVPPPGFRP